MNTNTTTILDDVTEILAAYGWDKAWSTGTMTDDYGNTVHLNNPTADDFHIEFEYALGGIVESIHLDPMHGAARIARVIFALASAPEN